MVARWTLTRREGWGIGWRRSWPLGSGAGILAGGWNGWKEGRTVVGLLTSAATHPHVGRYKSWPVAAGVSQRMGKLAGRTTGIAMVSREWMGVIEVYVRGGRRHFGCPGGGGFAVRGGGFFGNLGAMTNRGTGMAFYVPFLIGDALLLVAAWAVFFQGHRPMEVYEALVVCGSTAVGALLGVWPFVLSHRARLRREENAQLGEAVEKIQKLEEVAQQVEIATNKWQTAQDAADSTVRAAQRLGESIEGSLKEFREYVEAARQDERQSLRLEVQKLRQAEKLWLQVVVHMLDHTFALFTAAQRSGQARVIEQIGRFQAVCLDAVRRVGLVSLSVAPGTPYDPEQHEVAGEKPAEAEGLRVLGTLAPGYTYQGELLRKPLVAIREGGDEAGAAAAAASTAVPGAAPTPSGGGVGDERADTGPSGEEPASPMIDPDASEAPPSPS